MDTLKEVLAEEGYSSEQTLIKDVTLLFALSKIEQYQSECDYYQRKYEMSIKEFDSKIHKSKGKENFENEEDFEDWEFSSHALDWWKKRVSALKKHA